MFHRKKKSALRMRRADWKRFQAVIQMLNSAGRKTAVCCRVQMLVLSTDILSDCPGSWTVTLFMILRSVYLQTGIASAFSVSEQLNPVI